MKAICHPMRTAVTVTGWCRFCEPRALRLVEDAQAPPAACPKCAAGPPAWQVGEAESRCFYCGQRWQRRWMVTT